MKLSGLDPITLEGGNADMYYDYILQVNSVNTPYNAYKRSTGSSGDFDVVNAKDKYEERKLWFRYDQYTTKFELALFDRVTD